ncbi:hypothetical protein [Streptomyces sp. NRRL F-5727]|uniref:hypothetical protein n=1 Tax=Streptomyces sp. NRRL F-5727 TaxID=1463871 RepID=UPI0004C84640|nr:hypothetical protein [Streptomyces sp. NRRL F-5727]
MTYPVATLAHLQTLTADPAAHRAVLYLDDDNDLAVGADIHAGAGRVLLTAEQLGDNGGPIDDETTEALLDEINDEIERILDGRD